MKSILMTKYPVSFTSTLYPVPCTLYPVPCTSILFMYLYRVHIQVQGERQVGDRCDWHEGKMTDNSDENAFFLPVGHHIGPPVGHPVGHPVGG